MSVLPDIVSGHQLSTAYHALLLCYPAFWMVHASMVRVYGIALYLRLDLAFHVMHVPVRGVGFPSIGSFRERWSLRKASRLQMVTLSQLATQSQLLALASTWPTLASTEAFLTVELPQAVRPDRSTHRFTIQANAEVAAPESRGQR